MISIIIKIIPLLLFPKKIRLRHDLAARLSSSPIQCTQLDGALH